MRLDSHNSAFRGTAWYYARYRPDIPGTALDYLSTRFSLDGTGRCLDLGCGTGQLTFQLTEFFEEIVGLEPDSEMLTEVDTVGNRLGKSKKKIFWLNKSAEELKPQDGEFRLVTICRAFVWMDQYRVLDLLKANLAENSGIAVMGDGSFWSGTQAWQSIIKSTVQEFLGERRRAGGTLFIDSGEPYTDMLRNSGYHGATRIDLPVVRKWRFDEILGCLYSTSFAAKALFGSRLSDFERRLFVALGEPDSNKIFVEETDFTIQSAFWKPKV